MLDSGKKIRALCDKKKKILTLVLGTMNPFAQDEGKELVETTKQN
jgi:hypothetical protein